jgi:hypothetical protein
MNRETAHTPTHEQLQAGRDAAVRMWTECGKECESLKRQRDALVAALEELRSELLVAPGRDTQYYYEIPRVLSAINRADAAIKAAKP